MSTQVAASNNQISIPLIKVKDKITKENYYYNANSIVKLEQGGTFGTDKNKCTIYFPPIYGITAPTIVDVDRSVDEVAKTLGYQIDLKG